MRVAALNNNTTIRNNKKTQNNPTFKATRLVGLNEYQISNLYEDGPALVKFVRMFIPALEEKFGKLFDINLEVLGDFPRTIRANFVKNEQNPKLLANYIVRNNKSSLQLPQFFVDSLARGEETYYSMFEVKNFYPFCIKFADIGEQKATQEALRFIRTTDNDSIIRQMYEHHPFAARKS